MIRYRLASKPSLMKKICIFMLLLFVLNTNGIAAEENEPIKIYINLWKNELLVYQGNQIIEKFPISPGRYENPTPVGTFKVAEKALNWGGGFGTRWLGLDVPWGKYGIHGTNKPWLIGTSVSSGCIRMRNEDVEKLYKMIPVGTKVEIDGPIDGIDKKEFKKLARGTSGNLVLILQQNLKSHGYYKGKANGIFDEATEIAVKKMQKDYGLPVTGVTTKREYRRLGMIE
ncbi:L,D-transpeptidase family protein [Chengkuizengella axinellae]|uniref:L,D-transpeptidase family protein n=1 Tax=Chengkuizengella axinellae TaxID=3064388 RepID=A0ABT9J318_9BACL|nr:L,D-transpeptidase family protein [Chengkuizengella sp. 2205SS18-9]MDP5275863.1 L,D-transpeptidase family protein [Chengkuizengella sp. 2205SS18-9]